MKNNSANQQVQALKQNGVKVRFFYERYATLPTKGFNFRYVEKYGDSTRNFVVPNIQAVSTELFTIKELKEKGYEAYRNGGRVTVTVTSQSGEEVQAISECSIQDEFSKEKGRRIALGRALAELSKEGPVAG